MNNSYTAALSFSLQTVGEPLDGEELAGYIEEAAGNIVDSYDIPSDDYELSLDIDQEYNDETDSEEIIIELQNRAVTAKERLLLGIMDPVTATKTCLRFTVDPDEQYDEQIEGTYLHRTGMGGFEHELVAFSQELERILQDRYPT